MGKIHRFEKGDYVVSLKTVGPHRKENELLKVTDIVNIGRAIKYGKGVNAFAGEFRPATQYELENYEIGQIIPKQKLETKKVKPIKQVKQMKTLDEQIMDKVDEHLVSDESKGIIVKTAKKTLDEWGIAPSVTEIVVKQLDGSKIEVGKQHFKFKLILQAISAKVNIALVGPAGSGKTTAVANCAKSLGLEFYSKSVSLQTGVHEFFGYQDAHGKYVRTLFREAYEKGGIFLLDEFDAGNPNVLAALNQATANHHCAFADGMISKHKDFTVVMAGNTYGHGATSEYVGRNKIDAATLDRFAFIPFPYDEKLEMDICKNKVWCKAIQDVRKQVTEKKIKTIVSPRATFDGEKLLSVGMKHKDVIELMVYKGLNDQERNLIKVSYTPPEKVEVPMEGEELPKPNNEEVATVKSLSDEIETLRKKIDRSETWLSNKQQQEIDGATHDDKTKHRMKLCEQKISRFYAQMIELTSK